MIIRAASLPLQAARGISLPHNPATKAQVSAHRDELIRHALLLQHRQHALGAGRARQAVELDLVGSVAGCWIRDRRERRVIRLRRRKRRSKWFGGLSCDGGRRCWRALKYVATQDATLADNVL